MDQPEASLRSVHKNQTPAIAHGSGIAKVCACLALLFFVAYLLGGGLFQAQSFGSDASAYLLAAARLTSGAPLYAATDPDASEVYRYAPWFAAAWIPSTWLPQSVLINGWVALQGIAVGWLLWPLRKSLTRITLALLLAPFMLDSAWRGNVEPVMLVMMSLGRTQPGPVLLGLAGSLKVMPMMLVAAYIARREWTKVGIAVATFGILWSPALLLDFTGYPLTPTTMSPWSIDAWVGVAVASVAIGTTLCLALQKSRYTLLAASAASVIANPRVLMLNAGYFAVPARTVSSDLEGQP